MSIDVASSELSKELYEISHWENSDYTPPRQEPVTNWPTYSLGFLLRKLPAKIPFSASEITLRLEVQWSGGWFAHYGMYDSKAAIQGTPEDALVKLAIQLFKQGILKAEDKS